MGGPDERWRLDLNVVSEVVDPTFRFMPLNGASIGAAKVCTAQGWFAAEPSGTEPIYKIYAESFRSAGHLQIPIQEDRTIVDAAIGPA